MYACIHVVIETAFLLFIGHHTRRQSMYRFQVCGKFGDFPGNRLQNIDMLAGDFNFHVGDVKDSENLAYQHLLQSVWLIQNYLYRKTMGSWENHKKQKNRGFNEDVIEEESNKICKTIKGESSIEGIYNTKVILFFNRIFPEKRATVRDNVKWFHSEANN